MLAAKEYKDQLMRGNIAPISGVSWKEQGPHSLGGRTRALMVDPNDVTGNTVFQAASAAVYGRRRTSTPPRPIGILSTILRITLAVTSIAYDPSNTLVMYFTTGEGCFNLDAVQGLGV
ncbi:MAG: hypothetical protein IPJ30_25595 [Acidobacteria bacterium]|nr:hypothetical protein [Acidobacteriota bacterium]